jgi:glucan phosphoethanolaminetransferase (alkaline phosphatase superfamily)
MQQPPITLIVCIILSVLFIVFKNRIKAKNSKFQDFPEPWTTILSVLMLFAVTVIFTNIAAPTYFPSYVLDLARFINFSGLGLAFYRGYIKR